MTGRKEFNMEKEELNKINNLLNTSLIKTNISSDYPNSIDLMVLSPFTGGLGNYETNGYARNQSVRVSHIIIRFHSCFNGINEVKDLLSPNPKKPNTITYISFSDSTLSIGFNGGNPIKVENVTKMFVVS
jgi:hypothetical protein